METNEIIANNKLIAEFMTGESRNCTVFMDLNRSSNDLDYNKSWDWLMPVVEKIENIIYATKYSKCTDYSGNITMITIFADLTLVYNSVIEFIKWYNENK